MLFAGLLSRRSLSGLRFGAFFERGFARKLDAAFVVDPDALDPDHVADFCDVLRSFDAEIRKLGNVDEAVLAGENFDKGRVKLSRKAALKERAEAETGQTATTDHEPAGR